MKAYAPNKSKGKRKSPQTISYLRKASGFDPGTFEIVPLQPAGLCAIHYAIEAAMKGVSQI